MGREDRKRLQLAQKLSVDFAYIQTEGQRKAAEKANKNPGEDTKIRYAIHDFIAQKRAEGKTEEQILKRLKFVFGGAKYQKYHPYFEKWVNDAMKHGKTIATKDREDEEER